MADRQRQITEMREEVIRQVREEITRLVREEVERQQTGDQADGEVTMADARRSALIRSMNQDMAWVTAMLQMQRENENRDRRYNRYGGRTQFPRRFPWGGYGV
jgi:CRISPR/Cas system CMR subunit Cmr4 (Cas7 group RAMP superfamily)